MFWSAFVVFYLFLQPSTGLERGLKTGLETGLKDGSQESESVEKVEKVEWSGRVENGTITRESIDTYMDTVRNFVTTKKNKEVFVQLINADEAFFDPDTNIVGTAAYPKFNKYQQQPYVSNGYIGARIPNLGQGFTYDQLDKDEAETNLESGWPLFNKRYAGAFVAGFYDLQKNTTKTNFPELLDKGYESVIAAVPQWTTLELAVTIEGKEYLLDPENIKSRGSIENYVQTMSLQNGIVTTEFTWLNTFRVKYTVIAHRKHSTLGMVKVDVNNLNGTSHEVKVTDKLDFETAQRCRLIETGFDESGIFINFQPNDIGYINGTIYSNLVGESSNKSSDKMAAKNEISFAVDKQGHFEAIKYVGVATTDLDPDFKSLGDITSTAKERALNNDFYGLVNEHTGEWDTLLGSIVSVTFPGDNLLTMTSRASIFHLLANTRSNAEGVSAALGVTGLSSDSYGGMVFWDTDLWMLNAILPFAPDHAKSIVNYRMHTHQQAVENLDPGYSGAVYPWTSGRFGNCTATGPCMDYEYHINMAVSFAAWQVYLSGHADDDYLREVTYPLISDAAQFMADYVKYNTTIKEYTTHNLTDPDEYANHVDNGAYTNAATSLLMKYAIAISEHLEEEVPANFSNIVGNVHLPVSETDDDITLEYTGMNSTVGIKQADVIMITYPLENELITFEQAFTNMQFYAMKQVSYGPAMTFPIFSVVSSALSQTGCSSQSYLHKAVSPFLRAPFAQFSEQNHDDYETNGGTSPAFPFLTAHGGFVQSIVQGLTGMRYDFDVKNGKIERFLKFDPIHVPLFEGGVEIHGVKYMNSTLTLSVNSTHLKVFHQSGSNSVSIRIAQRNEMSGMYTIDEGETVEVPLYKTKLSTEGSICECSEASFVNITDGMNGDSAFSINDGDNFTHWQAASNDSAKVLVDLKEFRNITGGLINWGDSPPKSWKLSKWKSDFAAKDEEKWTVHDILASVDFGTDLNHKYRYFQQKDIIDQNDAFELVIEESVDVSSPFNESEFFTVQLPTDFNTTEFKTVLHSQFLLIEFEGVHGQIDPESTGGAKVFEVSIFD